MEGNLLIDLIRDVGVPGAVLVIVLLRLEPKLDAQTRAFDRLTDAVQLHVSTATRRTTTQGRWQDSE